MKKKTSLILPTTVVLAFWFLLLRWGRIFVEVGRSSAFKEPVS